MPLCSVMDDHNFKMLVLHVLQLCYTSVTWSMDIPTIYMTRQKGHFQIHLYRATVLLQARELKTRDCCHLYQVCILQ